MATALDPIFKAGSDLLYDLDGEACTIRRPHTLRRVPAGAVITELVIETQAEEDDTSLILELSGSGRFEGEIPAGLVLVLAGTSYTVQAAAEADNASKTITVAVSPPVAAQALAGAAVTVPSAASWAGTGTAAPRYMEDVVTTNSAFAARIAVGSKIYGIEKGSLSIDIEAGDQGDYIDVGGVSMGRVAQVLDDTPEDWTVTLR